VDFLFRERVLREASQQDLALTAPTDPACASVIAALEEDPFYRSICAPFEVDTQRRRAVLERYFAYSIQEGREIGRSVHLKEVTRGVAVWLLPQPAELQARAAQKKRAFLEVALDRKGCANYYGIVEFMSARAASVVSREAWYLSIVAVDPAVQGQGLGRQLLKPTLAEADSVGASCYLETFIARNLAFYEKLGFAARTRFREPTTGSEYAVMVRHPALTKAKRISWRR